MIFIIALVSCTKDQATTPTPETPNESITTANVSFSNFARQLFQSKCSSCHSVGSSASAKWTYTDLQSIRDHKARIQNAVLVAQTMPLGGTISDKEKELLAAWFERNMPEN